MIGKEMKMPDDIEASPPIAREPSQPGEILKEQNTYTHDAVFGEVTEDGPNYRNVSLLFPFWRFLFSLFLTSMSGWVVRDCRFDDENPDRLRCSLYSFSLRNTRVNPGSHYALRCCVNCHLDKLYGWRVQNQTS